MESWSREGSQLHDSNYSMALNFIRGSFFIAHAKDENEIYASG